MLDYDFRIDDREIVINFKPILHTDKKEYKIKKIHKTEKPSRLWFTATYHMNDLIGNIAKINKNTCSVKGVYLGRMQTIKNIKILDNKINRMGERVMVSEHVNIDGKFEFLATKSRILEGDLNFINAGWFDNGKLIRHLCIDVYTGESKIVEIK